MARQPCALRAVALLALALCAPAAEPTDSQEEVASKSEFLRLFGDTYGYGGRIDELFEREIAPRLPQGEHYLDFTGSSLYWNSQVEAAMKELQADVFGNPHSCNPSSARTERAVEALRTAVLRYLGADPAVYDLVWTRSGTGALHNLGETFPWAPASRFAYFQSNHNSVLGIREYARRAGAAFGAVTEREVEAWLAGAGDAQLPPVLREAAPTAEAADQHAAGGRRQLEATPTAAAQPALVLPSQDSEAEGAGAAAAAQPAVAHGTDPRPCSLFAFPAYDNYGGIMYLLRWVRAVQGKSSAKRCWKVLLDAAAYLPSHPLNLTQTPADYVDISFYKLFGYPTGVGAWVAKKEDVAAARKLYWGGGSVFLATTRLDWKLLKPQGAKRFEDGTLPFLNILGLQYGLQVYKNLGGPAAIERHTEALRAWLYGALSALRHSNGAPLLRILGRHVEQSASGGGPLVQGATFNFQILTPDGQPFSYRTASGVLAQAGFHMRCGCTCNPGACYSFTGVRDEEVRAAAQQAHGNFSNWEWVWVRRDTVDVPAAGTKTGPGGEKLVRLPLGSLRVSLGYMSRFEDVYALAAFLRRHYTDKTSDDQVMASVAAAVPATLREERQLRLLWATRADPGWC